MWQKIIKLFVLSVSAIVLSYTSANAQSTTPADQARRALENQGYVVLEVDFYPDAQGKPQPNMIYVMMEPITNDVNNSAMRVQVLAGFNALATYYPSKPILITVLKFSPYHWLFTTESNFYRQVLAGQITMTDYWNRIRGSVIILDTRTAKYYSSKDFSGGDWAGSSSQPSCSAGRFETFLFVQNNYSGQDLYLTLRRDYYSVANYKIPGDGTPHQLTLQPGRYSYTSNVGGSSKAGQPTDYVGGNCYPLTFSP